jgi:hypothetical protein
MNETWWIWFVALGGAAIGVAGGLLGTSVSIRRTPGPRERARMARAALVCWLLVIAFVLGLYFIPSWHKHLLWAPYAVLLVLWIRWCRRSQVRTIQERAGGAV